MWSQKGTVYRAGQYSAFDPATLTGEGAIQPFRNGLTSSSWFRFENRNSLSILVLYDL